MTKVLSVIIGSIAPGPVIHDCLAAIVDQWRDDMEVIVVDGSGDGTAGNIRNSFPQVRVIETPGPSSLPLLRGIGIAASTAPLVGILDAWCIVGAQWVGEAIQQHATHGAVAIGGGVDLAPTERSQWQAWVTYLYDYWEYVAPLPDGRTKALAGNNIVYKRSVFADKGALVAKGFWKAFVNADLGRQGEILRSATGLNVILRRKMPISRFLRSRYHHGRSYAGMRVEHVPWWRRMVWAVGTPALPVLFTVRQCRGLWRKRTARWWFVACLPVLAVLHMSWALGEFAGYVVGAGDSHLRIRS